MRAYTLKMYQVLYFTIHCIFTIIEVIHNIYCNVWIIISHEFSRNVKNTAQKKHKTPKHLTVLLGPEEPSFRDLTNILLWCLTAGISFVSFYDYKGTLKKNEDKFYAVVQESKAASDHVIWHENPAVAPKNGYLGRKIHVKVFSHTDGRKSVVDLTKKIVENKESDFSIANIDELFKKQFEFPDPDLGVYFGRHFCLYGYPPWQIRVTEFLPLSSHHNLTLDNFKQVLERYGKCEQRFGK